MNRQQKVNLIFSGRKLFLFIENLEEADRTKNEEITFWKLESRAESEKKCDWWIGITKENSNMVVATLATTQYLQRKSFALHCSSCAPNSSRRVPNSTESIGFG